MLHSIPLLLLTDGLQRGRSGRRNSKRRFHFEAFWAKDQACRDVVRGNWVNCDDLEAVKASLTNVSSALQRWNADTFGHIPRKIKQLNAELSKWPFDNLEEEVQLKRKEVTGELNKLLELEESIWKQRSRVNWLREGDRNTKFFHGFAKTRGRKNRVQGIIDTNGSWENYEEGIQQAFLNYFSTLFTSEGCNHMELVLDAVPQKVTEEMNQKLAMPFTRLEIETALKHMGPDKSPGEDGFSAQFYQTYWEVIGDDICRVCLKVLNEGAEISSLNHTLLALIPKGDNPKLVTDFRPISLCNVLYKLISKTLVNRMKTLLPEVISSFQSAFVPGRCIHDNVITAFEVIHSIRNRQTGEDPFCVLKLDISKAYDRVEWVFLRGIMLRLGFEESWVDLIMRCVQSVSFSVLWNGEAVGRFQPTRGLRQGDPVSPYLFLLCSEGLTGLFQKAGRDGLLQGVRVMNEAPAISHLLFADDSLLFGRADTQELLLLKQCLLLYESAAGQRINFQKSAISFGPGILRDQELTIVQLLGVPVVPFHERYLGLPTVAGRNRKEMFKKIHERLDHHLQGWQTNLLSKAGKTVLIKAVAQAIPSYAMSVFRLSKGICRTYQSKVSKYWWGSGGKKKGIHWCKWEVLCKNKVAGGLGFRDIECFNQALLAKTLWRIVLYPDSLVNQVLQLKYGVGGNWAAAGVGPKPSLIWRSLVWGKELLCSGIRWRIGNGETTRIWEDKWLPSPLTFRVATPRFMAANVTVNQLMERPGLWNISFIKENFLAVDAEKILSVPLCESSGGDVAIWHYTEDGYYTVKSGYWLGMELKQIGVRAECSGGRDDSNSKNVWSIIWGLGIPNKVKLFLWRACHSFLPCVERLFKRKISSQDGCGRCGRSCETVLHCLWECPKAQKVWKCSWLSGFVKHWKEFSFIDLLIHVATVGNRSELELFGLISWWIWKNRNDVLHGKAEMEAKQIVLRCEEWYSDFVQAQQGSNLLTGERQLEDCNTHQEISMTEARMFFDGAVDVKKGCVGFGAVIVNSAGNLVGALSIPLHAPIKPAATEALALWHGLKYCQELGLSRVAIQGDGDALNVLKGLNCPTWDLSDIGGILDAVRMMMRDFEIISWKHVKRRFNGVAHKLARSALSLTQAMFCKEDLLGSMS